MSEKLAKHPKTKDFVVFSEKEHGYYLNGNRDQKLISCTTFIGEYFEEFDSDKIAGFTARKRGQTKEEVLFEWSEAGRIASELGSKVHLIAEHILKNPDLVEQTIANSGLSEADMQFVKCLERTIPKLRNVLDFIDNEVIVFSPDSMRSGMIDLLMRKKDTKSVIIADWKTNKEILLKSKYRKKALGPISHLEDCNFVKYCLQLNFYRDLLITEGYFPKDQIFEMKLFHLFRNPESGHVSLKVMDVPNMQKEIDMLKEDWAKSGKGAELLGQLKSKASGFDF